MGMEEETEPHNNEKPKKQNVLQLKTTLRHHLYSKTRAASIRMRNNTPNKAAQKNRKKQKQKLMKQT